MTFHPNSSRQPLTLEPPNGNKFSGRPDEQLPRPPKLSPPSRARQSLAGPLRCNDGLAAFAEPRRFVRQSGAGS